jgi:hypothetical protein
MAAVTGIEPTAIAGAVAGAGKALDKINKAADEESRETDALLRIAEKSGDLDPAALLRAKRLVVRQHIRLKLLQPLGQLFGVPREYFNTQFADDMAERLADVPQEDIVSPLPSVAGPTMLGLGFSLDEPDLKAMYLNLLAAASDQRVQDQAHPSFAEIIKQVSASEAEALAITLKSGLLPLVEIRLNTEPPPPGVEQQSPAAMLLAGINPSPHGFSVLATNVLDWHTDNKQVAAPFRGLHIANWVRLGLVTVDLTTFITHEDAYKWVETTPLMVEAREQYDTAENKRVIFQKGMLKVTEFGKAFERVVISAEALKALPAAEAQDQPHQ